MVVRIDESTADKREEYSTVMAKIEDQVAAAQAAAAQREQNLTPMVIL